MKLYVIRHGETTWNVERKLQGASDTELNENGIALAIKTGKAMKEIMFYKSVKKSETYSTAGTGR